MKEQQPGVSPDVSQKKLPGFAHQRVLRFMHAAIADGAPQGTGQKADLLWARNLNIAATYVYTEAGLREIGEKYGLTRERVRQIRKATLTRLWENSSPRTQEIYPFETLPLRKPETLGMARHRSSAAGGKTVKVEQMLAEGKSASQIREELSLSARQLSVARGRLRKWGVEAPYLRRTLAENEVLARRLRESRDDEETQKLLGKVNRGFINRDRGRDEPVLASVTRAARDTSFYFQTNKATDFFVESLKRAGIPVGELLEVVKSGPHRGERRHLFIAAQHTARAQKGFLKDPNLQRFRENPVTQVCGPETQLPTITKLVDKRGYKFIHQHQVYAVPLTELLDGCPVPVFRVRLGAKKSGGYYYMYYYPEGEEVKLQEFIAKRLRELDKVA